MANDAFIQSDAELEAINDILSCIGETAITEIEGADDNADVANALRCLRNANREVQAQGWTWNTVESMTLTPNNVTKNIKYLDKYLRVMSTDGATNYRRRNDLVFDSTASTDKFDAPIQVKMVELQEYDEMPQCFRDLIVIRASRRYNIRFFGAAEIEAALANDEDNAYRICMEYEMDYGDFNMLGGDAWTGGRIGRS